MHDLIEQPGSKDIYKVRSNPPPGQCSVVSVLVLTLSHPLFHRARQRLHTQCTNMRIPTLPTSDLDLKDGGSNLDENTLSTALAATDVILDAIFGFSFKPPVRAPFDAALPLIARSRLPVVSVDIPSGWDVERGFGDFASVDDADDNWARVGVPSFLYPDVVVSLTAPKKCAWIFAGRHFLGGRFVPK